MNIQLLTEKCIACGLCQTISDQFDYDDEGIVIFHEAPQLLEKKLPDSQDVLQAVKSCPTKALSLTNK